MPMLEVKNLSVNYGAIQAVRKKQRIYIIFDAKLAKKCRL